MNYEKEYQKIVDSTKLFHDIQGQKGNWNYSPYMLGMYNGLELVLAVIEDREPVFREIEGDFYES